MIIKVDSINAKLHGVVSRGIKCAEIDENGHLIFTLTDDSTVDLGRVTGKGIVSIEKTGTSGLVDTYTIAFDDDTSTTFDVTNGNGISSITFKETDTQGNNIYTIAFTDGTTSELKANSGPKGDKFTYGDFTPEELADLKGDAGISVTDYKIVEGTHAPGTYDTYRMTLSDGTTFDCKVWNGANGEGSGDMMAAIYDSHGKTTDIFDYVDNAIASIPTPDVSSQINAHNESETAHNDIRTGKQDKITASGLLKGDGSGGVTPAVAGTDYQTPLTTEGAQNLGIDATPTSRSNNLVTSGGVYTSLANKADISKKTTVTLSTSWSGDASPYTQSVTISGSTANSKVDIQPDASVIAQLAEDGTVSLYIANDNGTLTAYAVGEKPTVEVTVQATITEVGT